jgi:spermidine synthase
LRRDAYAEFSREVLVHEVRSKFSHIRVKDRGSLRTLYFVRDSGEEVVETSMDLRAPHILQVPYTRTMFASFLLRPRQQICLIVGLGGGAMVRFLNHFFPYVKVDAVEIDPAVVKIARDYFGTKPGANTRIFTEDAFSFLKRTGGRYDVIYMDAFLKPSEATDPTGAPRHLKTISFLKSLHKRLREGGMMVININESGETFSDLKNIQAAFPSLYAFRTPASGNVIAVGSLAPGRLTESELRKRGEQMDGLMNYGLSFRGLVDQLSRP